MFAALFALFGCASKPDVVGLGALGAVPELAHPRQALEPFFLDVVRRAAGTDSAAAAPTGATPAAPLAPFLRG